jgi:DNA-binding LytR/AlgR family response regulator
VPQQDAPVLEQWPVNGGPTALIAEDEPLLQAELVEALGRLWPGLAVVGRASNGIQALRLLIAERPTVAFLDIQMPGLTGLEVARQAAGRSHVVFVTAHDEHALAAFDHGAIDYVVKPIAIERLATTVRRLKDRIAKVPADLSGILAELVRPRAEARSYLRWVNASVGNAIKLITVDEICYFMADSKYTLVVTPDSESLIKKTVRDLVGELDPTLFWQIHRSTLVNVNAISGVVRDLRGHLKVRLKRRSEVLPVSETYAHRFRQM